MAQIDERKIEEIVGRVVDRLLSDGSTAAPKSTSEPYCAPAPPQYSPPPPRKKFGHFSP